ncbi:MAG TPA: cysteine synthase, partial [Candidatus Bathyarchaeia archaeon]|nr:cysteine synthase [Candidatus Bathyarchaeia archaeon]
MQEPVQSSNIDHELLEKFDREIWQKTPHLTQSSQIANPTPLVDITDALLEVAKKEYGLELSKSHARVFAKFDSQIFGGSVKVRPAIEIARTAIVRGDLRRGQKIFEATSGNFGLALGLLKSLGLDVIV